MMREEQEWDNGATGTNKEKSKKILKIWGTTFFLLLDRLSQNENKNDYLAELTYKIAEKALARP